MAQLRISELAEATGFPTATLRYYETIGLLAPERDPNGYRRYGDADVARLHFVGRAKQLGLRLEEIAELVELRGSGSCPPVRGRLAGVVADKLRDTYRSIGELTLLAGELSRLAAAIGATEPPETCGDGCGCPDHPIDLAASPPAGLACSLDDADIPTRMAEWRALVAVGGTEPTERG